MMHSLKTNPQIVRYQKLVKISRFLHQEIWTKKAGNKAG